MEAEGGGAVGRAGGARGGVRGEQLEAVRGAGVASQPPRFPGSAPPGRGGVRLRLPPRPTLPPLRRVPLRGPPPPHLLLLLFFFFEVPRL
ncbi:Auxin responsive protein [Musa troglodytarum]|uniref:Auxin responsive protein n=1 Tax=Musa troglodytarum TaxID=320322 RepID=A0A9E7KLB3_9LILI|nr:Auxin responsive protein [Musa troglodytarum]